MTGNVHHGKERDHCCVLTKTDKSTLVEYIKNCNRSYQPLNRKDVTKLIVNILAVRDANKKRLHHRNCTRLNSNAQRVLRTKTIGNNFLFGLSDLDQK